MNSGGWGDKAERKGECHREGRKKGKMWDKRRVPSNGAEVQSQVRG